MKSKLIKVVKITISLIIFILLIFSTPKFLDFMEIQNNILKIPMQNELIIDNNVNIVENNIVDNEIKDTNKISNSNNVTSRGSIPNTRKEEINKKTNEKKQHEKKSVSTKLETKIKTPSTTNTNGYVKFTATAYCPCKQCCGKTNGVTASGAKAKAGITVAMPSKYKFGTKIEIKGMGIYIVQDRGGAINGNRIDIFFSTHKEALQFGRRTVYLKIIE